MIRIRIVENQHSVVVQNHAVKKLVFLLIVLILFTGKEVEKSLDFLHYNCLLYTSDAADE